MKNRLLPLIAVLLVATTAWSQEITHQATAEHSDHEQFRHFRVAALIGHTFVPTPQSSRHLAIASWGLDLEYWFNRKWGLGLHNDFELQHFIIMEGDGEELERDYPVVLTLDLLFKPWKGLVFLIGPGYEFEKNENFFLVRAGVEYEIDLPNHWDLSPSFFYDTRRGAYDTWTFSLAVGKRF